MQMNICEERRDHRARAVPARTTEFDSLSSERSVTCVNRKSRGSTILSSLNASPFVVGHVEQADVSFEYQFVHF